MGFEDHVTISSGSPLAIREAMVPNDPTALTRVTYGMTPWVRWLCHLLIGAPLIFVVGLIAVTHERPLDLVFAGLVAFVIGINALTFWYLACITLLLSPAGVRVRNFGITMEAPWSDVEAVVFEGAGYGLVLNKPAQGRGAKRFALFADTQTFPGVPLLGRTQRHWQRQERWLSLDNFRWWIRHGDLLERLDSFAPQLHARQTFEAARRRPKPSEALAPDAGRSDWRGWVVLTTFCAVAFGMTALVVTMPTVGTVIAFVVCALLIFCTAAYAIVGAARSIVHHHIGRAVLCLVCGAPAIMVAYFMLSGVAAGMKH